MFNLILDNKSTFAPFKERTNKTAFYCLLAAGIMTGIWFHYLMSGWESSPENVYWGSTFSYVVYTAGALFGLVPILSSKKIGILEGTVAFAVPMMMPVMMVLSHQIYDAIIAS